jgi:ribosomal protein S1
MITKEQVVKAFDNLPPSFSLEELLRELAPFEKAWNDEWDRIATDFKLGTEVTGQVVHKAPFGDFIEIGASEPALLEITSMPTLTPELYKLGEYNPLDSTVKAWVVGIIDRSTKQLRLTQYSSTDFDGLANLLSV